MTRIAELRALLGRAPSGPWKAKAGHNEAADQWDVVDPNEAIVCEWSTRDEATLIAAAVNSLPALLDVAEAARRMNHIHEDREVGGKIVEVACDLCDALAKLESP